MVPPRSASSPPGGARNHPEHASEGPGETGASWDRFFLSQRSFATNHARRRRIIFFWLTVKSFVEAEPRGITPVGLFEKAPDFFPSSRSLHSDSGSGEILLISSGRRVGKGTPGRMTSGLLPQPTKGKEINAKTFKRSFQFQAPFFVPSRPSSPAGPPPRPFLPRCTDRRPPSFFSPMSCT